MDGDAIGMPELPGLMVFAAPWKFDGIFIERELGHFELRFSCPRGTRHHCTECGVMDQPAHDFLDMVREHERFLGYRCFVRARVPRTGRGHCGAVRRAEVPRARPDSGSRFSSRRFSFRCAGRRPRERFGSDGPRRRPSPAGRQPLRSEGGFARESERRQADRDRREVDQEGPQVHDGVHGLGCLPGDCMCEGRGSETIARFVEHLESHGGSRDSIEWARIDMSPAYISGMAKHLPGATVVFDKFHVVQLANRAMEAVRRLEQQGGVEDLKRTRWLWLMDGDELSPEQVALVAALVRKRPRRRGRS